MVETFVSSLTMTLLWSGQVNVKLGIRHDLTFFNL